MGPRVGAGRLNRPWCQCIDLACLQHAACIVPDVLALRKRNPEHLFFITPFVHLPEHVRARWLAGSHAPDSWVRSTRYLQHHPLSGLWKLLELQN